MIMNKREGCSSVIQVLCLSVLPDLMVELKKVDTVTHFYQTRQGKQFEKSEYENTVFVVGRKEKVQLPFFFFPTWNHILDTTE